MNNILISSDSRYPISRPKIRNAIKSVLKENKIVSDVEVSVLICGARKATDVAKKYLNDDQPHNVLSFVLEDEKKEKGRSFPPVSGQLVLGDIIVCYPIAQEEANADNLMVDVKINELVSHGLRHLLGQHHD